MFKMLTSSPVLSQSHLDQSALATIILYYWCTFFMRLVFGSFAVAVLVGAFNSVKTDIAKEEKEDARHVTR